MNNSSTTNPSPNNKGEPTHKIQYKTSDLFFGSFLCSLDFPLKGTEKDPNNSSKVVFVFEIESGALVHAKRLYFGGQGTVLASKFVDNMRRLKSLCYI